MRWTASDNAQQSCRESSSAPSNPGDTEGKSEGGLLVAAQGDLEHVTAGRKMAHITEGDDCESANSITKVLLHVNPHRWLSIEPEKEKGADSEALEGMEARRVPSVGVPEDADKAGMEPILDEKASGKSEKDQKLSQPVLYDVSICFFVCSSAFLQFSLPLVFLLHSCRVHSTILF